MVETNLAFACPHCANALSSELTCLNCGMVFELRDGIYRFLLPERCGEILPFLNQYRLVREREGYRSFTEDDYCRLPDTRAWGVMADIWRVRRESFDRLLTLLGGDSLSILDLGAGNGWLSHRLVRLGHSPVAVDWLDDASDGLGVRRHYPLQFACVQADFDALPFMPGQFEVVIFNASLHYSPDLIKTLRKVCQMLKPEGRIFVIDSPAFHSAVSGQIMLHEQRARLHETYDLHEVNQPGIGYLTMNGMTQTEKTLGISFQFYQSSGPLLWALKRWWVGVKGKREPAAFGVWEGTLL